MMIRENGKATLLCVNDGYRAHVRLPILLLADSQLLFWKSTERPFLQEVRDLLTVCSPKAAYIGAANGNLPEFFDLFRAAMTGVGIEMCRMIGSDVREEDVDFVREADIVLLAGGDERAAWDSFVQTGLDKSIFEGYRAGGLLIGVSAGAVQLGLFGGIDHCGKTLPRLGLLPYVIGVHGEADDWADLRANVMNLGVTGLGIPGGGGALYNEDCSVQPVRYPITEVTVKNQLVTMNLIAPAQSRRAAALALREGDRL